MQISKTLKVLAQEERVIKNNACKGFVKPPLFLMHLHSIFPLSFCNLNLRHLHRF